MSQKQNEKYLQRVAEWLKLTKGEEGLELLKNEETAKLAMIEYNKAYEKFVYKFLSTSPCVKKKIMSKVCSDVYNKIKQ